MRAQSQVPPKARQAHHPAFRFTSPRLRAVRAAARVSCTAEISTHSSDSSLLLVSNDRKVQLKLPPPIAQMDVGRFVIMLNLKFPRNAIRRLDPQCHRERYTYVGHNGAWLGLFWVAIVLSSGSSLHLIDSS
jgi:hypothetical protein